MQQQLQQNSDPNAPLAFANPGDDIWIIVKPAQQDETQPNPNEDDTPGSGAMLAVFPANEADPLPNEPRPLQQRPQQQGQQQQRQAEPEPTLIPMPLKHTEVKARVAGYIATVDVTQQFHNPFDQKIEAIYQFPLPQDSAVSEFVMEVGPLDNRRQIRGIIREKDEAERIYANALREGFNASLLSQVRPNIFEQKVANIEPGKQIDIHIRYFNTLSYADGWYTFAFPMVVGPRYNPANTADPIHAIGRDAKPDDPRDPNSTTISYLRPDERSGHDIALTLELDAGVSIEASRSLTHAIIDRNPNDNPNRLHVELSPNDTIPNKDFVFAFRVAGERMKSGLVTHTDDKGRGYFTLMLYPPAELETLERQPMEMVFVLDCSGSMNGRPMQQSKDAMRHALKQLRPTDTFQIIRFSNDASALGPEPIPATPSNIRYALRYIDRLNGKGGTEMIEGIKAALDFPHDPQRYRVVTFLTDGYIGNEAEILREMQQRIGTARVFSFGVGTSTNRYLLERMASVGRGAAAYLLPDDNGKQVMELYFDRISHPAMTDLQISWGGAQVAQVYPTRTPDLLVGRPVILTGRYNGELNDITISGHAGGQKQSIRLSNDNAAQHPALDQVWARRKIMDMMNRQTAQNDEELKPAVLATALEYGLVSAYTSFLAVDASRVTPGGDVATVNQAVPVPEGVPHDTTVQE